MFAALNKFGILGVHIAPNEAVKEINALTNVIHAARSAWSTEVCNKKVIIFPISWECYSTLSQDLALIYWTDEYAQVHVIEL